MIQSIFRLYKHSTSIVKMTQPLTINRYFAPSFPLNQQLKISVLDFDQAQHGQEIVQLKHEIWNQPLRRDLVHITVKYEQLKGKIRTHISKTVGTVSGSGKKPHA